MVRTEQGERYSTVAILLHWTTAALVVFNVVVGLGHEPIPALRALMPAHKAVGITVLALTLARLAWRLAHRPPPLPASVPAGERRLAWSVQSLFYALLLLMPLTGWMLVSGPERRPLTWFGAFDIPYLPIGKAASDAADGAHGVLGWVLLALVLLHVAGALRHHLLLRDATLVRMAPWWARG